MDVRETPGQSWPLKVAVGEGCRAEGEGEAGALGDEQEMPGPPKSQGWGHGPAGPLWLFRDGDGHPAETGVAGLRKMNITDTLVEDGGFHRGAQLPLAWLQKRWSPLLMSAGPLLAARGAVRSRVHVHVRSRRGTSSSGLHSVPRPARGVGFRLGTGLPLERGGSHYGLPHPSVISQI